MMSLSHFVAIVLICSVQYGYATTVIVSGISQWKNTVAQIGDSIVFSYEDQLKLYIFRNEEAFSTCNFTEATLLNKPNSTISYTWNPTRPGIFFFSFGNGTFSSCQKGKKWAIKVVLPLKNSVEPAAAPKLSPAPISGGLIPSSPVDKFPNLPSQGANSPEGLGVVPQKGGGIVIIDSNPAVPLPTDAADSIGSKEPVHASHGGKQVRGGLLMKVHASLCILFCLMF